MHRKDLVSARLRRWERHYLGCLRRGVRRKITPCLHVRYRYKTPRLHDGVGYVFADFQRAEIYPEKREWLKDRTRIQGLKRLPVATPLHAH